MGFYHLNLFLDLREDFASLYFGLLCIGVALVQSGNDQLMDNIFDKPYYFIGIRLLYLGMFVGILSGILFTGHLFPKAWYKKVSKFYVFCCSTIFLIVLFAPLHIFSMALIPFFVLAPSSVFFILVLLGQNFKKDNSAKILFFTMFC